MDLYHSEIRLPRHFDLWWSNLPTRVNLNWTRHADRARKDDRYGEIPAFQSIPLSTFRVIEVGMENRSVAKVVVRGRWTKEKDVVFVLIPTGGAWTVKTVWINLHSDTHKTLDRSKYVA